MNKTQKLIKLAETYQTKWADNLPSNDPAIDLPTLKKVIRSSLDDAWYQNFKVMDGFISVSGVNYTGRVMGNTVSFTLYLDKNKKNIVDANKPQRDLLVNQSVKAALKKQYNKDFDIAFVEEFI